MKTKLCFTAIAAFAFLCLSSCKKDGPGRHGGFTELSSVVLNINLAHGNAYNLNLSSYGNGAATITKQADLFDISEITYNSAIRSYIYTYSNSGPKNGGALTDKVVLKVTNEHTEAGGCRGNSSNRRIEEKMITVNFTVN